MDAREDDTLTEGSLQGQIVQIEEYIRRQQNMDIFFKSVLLEVFSFTVCICVFYYYNISKENGDVEPVMYTDSVCRLVFCLSAHLIMQVQIDATIDRLKFVITHPGNFRTPFVPIFLCILHLVVNFGNEIIMLTAILHDDDILAMLGDFTGVYIVSEIPCYYFEALTTDLKKEMTEEIKAKRDIWTMT